MDKTSRRARTCPARHDSAARGLLFAGLLSAALGVAPTARAQMMAGTCTGTINNQAVSGNIYLNVPLSDGRTVRLDPTMADGNAGGVFNRAECDCKTGGAAGVRMSILMKQPIPLNVTAPGITLWYGSSGDCGDPVNQQNTCYQVTPVPAEVNLGSFQTSMEFSIPLQADVLSSPRGNPRTCDSVQQTSLVNILIGAPSNPVPITCKLNVSVNTIPPTISNKDGVTIAAGDGALEVRFPTELTGVRNYQVLCRDQSAPKVPLDISKNFKDRAYYSTCVNGNIRRRIEIPGSSASGSADMASSSADMSLAQAPPVTQGWRGGGGWTPQADDMAATSDMTSPPDMTSPADLASDDPFLQLDPSFLCSDKVQGSGGTASARIDGLTNGKTYELLVVAIDAFGNTTQFNIKTAAPKPAQNLGEALGKGLLAAESGSRRIIVDPKPQKAAEIGQP